MFRLLYLYCKISYQSKKIFEELKLQEPQIDIKTLISIFMGLLGSVRQNSNLRTIDPKVLNSSIEAIGFQAMTISAYFFEFAPDKVRIICRRFIGNQFIHNYFV